MKYAKPLIGSALLIGLMLAASAWAWGRLGDGQIAVHFGIDGQPNGYAPKAQGLLILPAVSLLIVAILAILPPLMPARGRLERSWGPYVVTWQAMLVLLLAIHLTLIAFALGKPVDIGRVVCIGIGALIAVIGNFLGKVRYNFVFGFRTPWTLANEQVWDRTHRFVGWAMTLAGLLLVAVGIMTPRSAEVALPVAIAIVAIGPALAGLIYSIVESRRIERGLEGRVQ